MNDKTLSKFRNLNLGFQFHQLLPEFTLEECLHSPFIANKPKRKLKQKQKLLDIWDYHQTINPMNFQGETTLLLSFH
jgi:lipoprotein-releasing system ATP-binding protein